MKEELLSNIKNLNGYEFERLKTELYGDKVEDGLNKFINFIKQIYRFHFIIYIIKYLPFFTNYITSCI